jgi:hypothetical protein
MLPPKNWDPVIIVEVKVNTIHTRRQCQSSKTQYPYWLQEVGTGNGVVCSWGESMSDSSSLLGTFSLNGPDEQVSVSWATSFANIHLCNTVYQCMNNHQSLYNLHSKQYLYTHNVRTQLVQTCMSYFIQTTLKFPCQFLTWNYFTSVA